MGALFLLRATSFLLKIGFPKSIEELFGKRRNRAKSKGFSYTESRAKRSCFDGVAHLSCEEIISKIQAPDLGALFLLRATSFLTHFSVACGFLRGGRARRKSRRRRLAAWRAEGVVSIDFRRWKGGLAPLFPLEFEREKRGQILIIQTIRMAPRQKNLQNLKISYKTPKKNGVFD